MIPSEITSIEDSLGYFICHLPTLNHARMIYYEKLRNEINLSPIRFNQLDSNPVRTDNLESCQIEADKRGLELRTNVHSIFWQYLPQNDTYWRVGKVENGIFNQFMDDVKPNLDWGFGEIGLNFSFFDSMEKFLESRFDILLWLEDDTQLGTNWFNQLTLLVRSIKFEFDVINLANCHDENSEKDKKLLTSNPLILLPYSTRGAHCIAITRSGAEKYIEFIRFYGPALGLDWILWNVRSPQTRDQKAIHFLAYFVNPRFTSICPWSNHYLDQSLSTIVHKGL